MKLVPGNPAALEAVAACSDPRFFEDGEVSTRFTELAEALLEERKEVYEELAKGSPPETGDREPAVEHKPE